MKLSLPTMLITLCTAIAFSKYPTNNTPLDERFFVHRADQEAVV